MGETTGSKTGQSSTGGKGNTNTKSASSEGNTTRGRTGAGTGAGNQQADNVTKSPGMVDVTIPVEKTEQEKAGESKKSTSKSGSKSGSKSKSKKNSNKQVELEMQQNLSMLLHGVFGMLGEKDSIWQVSDSELENVINPASRIIGRLYNADKFNENADYIMLVTGLGMLLAPRFLMIQQRKKLQGGGDNAGDSRTIRPVPTKQEGQSSTGNGNNTGKNTSHVSGDVRESIPALDSE